MDTAAAWLAARALAGTARHGTVLPVVLLNGQKMGCPSLLSTLTRAELDAYFTGLGHRPFYSDGHSIAHLRRALADALDAACPLGAASPGSVLVLTLDKGHGAPGRVAGRPIAGTPAVHKTPLPRPTQCPEEFTALQRWLTSYRPGRLLTPDGRPHPTLLPALPTALRQQTPLEPPRGCIAASTHVADATTDGTLPQAIPAVLRARADQDPFRVFSPDELASNRIDLTDEHGRPLPWVVEILSEEICHAWAQGYTETGRHALIVGYEAFAPITASLIQQQLKHRALRRHAQLGPLPSIVPLLTSLGWHNTYTHQNPSLTSALLASGDPTVHVLTPADPARTAAALTFALRKLDRSGFTALDAATGEVRWTRRKSGLHRVAAAGSTVLLWNDNREDGGKIAGVDALTGEPLWEDEFERIWGLLVRGDRVILDAGGNRALEARTGEELWHKGYGTLLEQGETGDAAVFHNWNGRAYPELSVRASDSGKQLAAIRFPQRALKQISDHPTPTLVDGGRVLFAETFGRRVRLFAHSGLERAEPLASVRLGRWRLTSFSERPVCVGDWVYAVTWRHGLYAAEAGGRRGLRRLKVTFAPYGRVVRPTRITAGPEHLFVTDGKDVAGVRDDRVLWVTATGEYDSKPLPLGADRVLFGSRSRDGKQARLHCADAETGRRLP
ncbi:PQQ-binding-like beta-propeller repeat protein [Streptomyces colonosanans]|uniref:outer membrane protein assembly factor BamB family protein n=1 Tax=Streptomyces colonosanans TaxID=1428652 RepID=UPI000A42E509|nr:PQQ-binding-like beta-propeller repeat protein [Streptomyces colonosanans]